MTQIINEKLGAWLLTPGNTRDILAEKIGITRQTLDKRLVGASGWKWQEVIAVSQLTGASLNELAGI